MGATDQEIEAVLRGIVQSVLPRAEFRPGLKLTPREIWGWDSLNFMKILSRIEKRYAIKFIASELPGLRTMSDLVDLVASKTRSDQAS